MPVIVHMLYTNIRVRTQVWLLYAVGILPVPSENRDWPGQD
jgi:hypothetical protein